MQLTADQLIQITPDSGIPKYQQIIESVYRAIEEGSLEPGDQMPSLNAIKEAWSLSRDTVLVAFNELRARGIVASTPGKGYFVQSTAIAREQKIFLLFDEFNPFKETLYQAFIDALGPRASVDMYFHYFNKQVFQQLIEENRTRYTTFVIMPVAFTGIAPWVETLTNGQVYMLDQQNPELAEYPGIFQHFRKDMFHALQAGWPRIKRYKQLIMVYPGGKEPQGQLEGYRDFCQAHGLPMHRVQHPAERPIAAGNAYIVPNDRHLVYLVKQAREQGLALGHQVGIISYNDTPLKEIAANGITTISTDFAAMGRSLADMVLNKQKKHIENPASLIIRGSL